jgi:hypothetical protein
MKAYLIAILLIASGTTFGYGQTPGQSQDGNQALQEHFRRALQPSPGERERCNQPRELLNASSRDACRAIGR